MATNCLSSDNNTVKKHFNYGANCRLQIALLRAMRLSVVGLTIVGWLVATQAQVNK